MREPPHNFDAEQALLGAIMASNTVYHSCSEFLQPEHFADPLHGRLYGAMAKLIERGLQASPLTMKTFVEADPDAAKIGGARYLVSMMAIGHHDPKSMARTVRDLYLRRQLIALSQDVANDAYADNPDQSAVEQIEATERRLYGLAETGQAEGGAQTFAKALTAALVSVDAAFNRKGKTSGLSTGFRGLDAILGGLHKSDLVILAGRPSMGKTALATNIAFNVVDAYQTQDNDGETVVTDGGVVAFFSLEMSAEQLANRILAERADVPSERLRRGDINQAEYDRAVFASAELERVPLLIDDTGALTLSALRTRARRIKRQHGLHLIVIDYLQLIQPPSNRNRSDGRVQEVSEITRGLKQIAKELDVPVLALSQLSRAVEQREDKRPQLADLRESGSIEQDADVVMFVYRDEYYAQRAEPQQSAPDAEKQKWRERMIQCAGKADVLIEKQRHGPIGDVRLAFDGRFTRFSDVEQDR